MEQIRLVIVLSRFRLAYIDDCIVYRRQPVVVLPDIFKQHDPVLFQVGKTGDGPRFCPRRVQCGKQHYGKNCNN